jgi:DNA polymerase-4
LSVPQTILHLDLDAFFCSVEEIRHPELKGKPFAVGGQPGARGVVSSCSYAARQYGVRSAMPMSQALRLCPGLQVISVRHGPYGEMSRRVMDKLENLAPMMEQISIDEAFLEISRISEPPDLFARKLQNSIRDDLGLPCSIGVASNRLVAKIATEVGKHAASGTGPPFALTIVPAGEEACFLAPLPVEMLWGVGPKTATKLKGIGIHTIGDVARWPESGLIDLLGETGRELAQRARGQDEPMILTEHEQKSMSQETTFARDINDDRVLEQTIRHLSEDVGGYLRKAGLAGATIRLKIRWPDFTTLTRQSTLTQRTDDEDEISKVALELLKRVRKPGQPVRLIGVAVAGLGIPVRQLNLWEGGSERSRRLKAAVDELRERYGDHAIRRGER